MLGRLCTETIVDVEAQVVKQREADEAEAKKLADEAKKLADEKKAKEAVRLATEQKIREMQEELAKMSGADLQPGPDQNQRPLQYIQMGGGDDEEDDDEDEEDEVIDSGSAGEEQQVRQHFYLFHTHFNYKLSQESSKKKTKRQPEDSRKKLVQVVHATVSTLSH